MTGFRVEMTLNQIAKPILVPCGLDTPLSQSVGLTAQGGHVRAWTEHQTGQTFAQVTPETDQLTLVFAFDGVPARYPDAVFQPTHSRYTIAANDLLYEVAGLGQTPRDIARAVAQRFVYGHPDQRFHDGHEDKLPALGFDRAIGSCVDINMYFLAALRAAGIEAGYIAGAFFPAEKGDWCSDGHCWVVTRTAAGLEEWDIAHHLKMGRRDIDPALNPRPGFRAALSHGLGLFTPTGGLIKLLAEPVEAEAPHHYVAAHSIRLFHPDIPPGPIRPTEDAP